MVSSELPGRRFMPLWLRRYLALGMNREDPRDRRRQFICNLIGLFATTNASFFALMHVAMGLDVFWMMAVHNIIMAVSFFALPFAFNRSDTLGAAFVLIVLYPVFFSICALAGKSTGVHFNFLAVPIGALLVVGPKRLDILITLTVTSIISIIFCEMFFDTAIVEAYQDASLQAFNFAILLTMITLVIILASFAAFKRAEIAEDALAVEHARSEALLYNLLPEEIAARLKAEPSETIADDLPSVAILFADVVDFTARASALPPAETVKFLNRIFSTFDELAKKHRLEKIKTIGDAYMVAAGVPSPVGDPVHRVANMALDMRSAVADMSAEFPDGLQVRIGLHTGPAVAGVIGNQKLFYDVWGETVNTSSRMESHGEPGRIQVTIAAKEVLEDAYNFERRGNVTIKGMGDVETWFLLGAKAAG